MNNTDLRNAVLTSIDDLESVVQEAEFDVLSSLIDSTDKAVMLMENYTGDDLDMFAIFQEAEVSAGDPAGTDADAKKKSWLDADKDEGFIMKILKFIPRLLRMLWGVMKKAWTGEVQPAVAKAVETAKSIPEKAKGLIDKIFGSDDEGDVKEILTKVGIGVASIAAISGIVIAMRKINKTAKLKIDEWISNTKNFFAVLKGKDVTPVWRIHMGSSTVKTNLDITSLVNMMSDDMRKLLSDAGAFDVTKVTSYDAVAEKFNKLIKAGQDIGGLKVIGETKEISFDEIKKLFDKMGVSIPQMLDLVKNAADNLDKASASPFFQKHDALNTDNAKKDELKKVLSEAAKSVRQLVPIMNYSLSLSQVLGMSLKEYIERADELAKKLEKETSSDADSSENTSEENAEENTAESSDKGTEEDSDDKKDEEPAKESSEEKTDEKNEEVTKESYVDDDYDDGTTGTSSSWYNM